MQDLPRNPASLSVGPLSGPFRGFLAAVLWIVILVGIADLLGWYIHSETLVAVLPGHATMKPNTALCFILSSAGVLAAIRPGRTSLATIAAGVATLTIALLTFAEYVSGVNLHIDQVLFRDPFQSLFPGRMAHITAIEFCLAGVVLLLMRSKGPTRLVAQLLSFLLVCIAYAAMVGSLYGVPILYGQQGYTSMAFHTGIGFLLLGTALLFAVPESHLLQLIRSHGKGSWLARRLILPVLITPALLGRLYMLPAANFNSPPFGMALLAVTLAVAGLLTLLVVSLSLNQNENLLASLDRERERDAAKVRQSEKELLLITDELPMLLSYVDVDGRFLRVNRRYEQWLGKPANEVLGKTVEDLLGTEYWNSTAHARKAIRAGQSVTFDALYPTHHGSRQAQVSYAPDIDEQGNLRGFVCLVLDIHERFMAERALRQTEKLAAVGRLASSIAHEMNNPLEAVTNLLYLATLEPIDPVQAKHYAEQAQTELTRVTHIVTQTLRFHRQSVNPILCQVAALASQVIALYQGRIAQKHITLYEKHGVAEPLLCQDGEIRQVLANLVGNAVDAMDSGGRLYIRTKSFRRIGNSHSGMIVTIADTGHGISAETRRHLFEPFHTTKGATGSGLGLWISKEIVDRHHGQIRIRSSQRSGSSGTVFQIYLYGSDPVA